MTCWAATLPVAIDMNRFLDDKHHTKFEINYQVKYKNLSFVEKNKGYFADLIVQVEILKGDSVLTQKEFTNKIGVSSQNDADSDQKSYMDKISLVLAGISYKIRITFTDPKTKNTKVWNQDLIELPMNHSLSDIELSKSIIPADTTKFMLKFRRNNWIYMVEPSHVYYPANQDSMYVFYQLYGLSNEKDEELSYETEYRLIKEGKDVRTWKTDGKAASSPVNVQKGISIKDLPFGLYDLEILYKSGLTAEKSSNYFVLGEIKEEFAGVFPRMEDETVLLKYFFPNTKLASLGSLSSEAKKRMVNQLWTSQASEHKMTVQQWTTQVKERVSYANRYYSHFKPGWETDRGRIYIRMGAPDDITKGNTSDDSKFVQKDYQVWKYASNDRVYVFIDIQMNGNYKMIYAKNDDNESSLADWKRYLGESFDENDLEKDSSYPGMDKDTSNPSR
jgi:GWxTD domain-containing protein